VATNSLSTGFSRTVTVVVCDMKASRLVTCLQFNQH
jgi:hypothetical protein